MSGLTLATYNIHKCVGSDGRWDPERILAVIAEMQPDVLAIQEFDSRRRRGRGMIPAETLAAASGMSLLVQPTLSEAGRFHGNLLLSRLPIVCWRGLDLSVPTAEPRAAIRAVVGHARLRLTVAATHLGLAPDARRTQLQRLLGDLGPDEADALVLLGDLNEWLPRGGVRGLLDQRFGRQGQPATYPAPWPLLALDTVRVWPAAALRDLRAHDSPTARRASDHLPLVARLDLAPLMAARRKGPGARP